jgi:hypothetical protein
MTHTPGPWRLDHPDYDLIGDDFHVIDAGNAIRGAGFSIREFMSLDDARLICAAPDLLAAAKMAANGTGAPRIQDILNTAITKAEQGK